MVTFTEEILNGKLHFLCSVSAMKDYSIKANYYFYQNVIYRFKATLQDTLFFNNMIGAEKVNLISEEKVKDMKMTSFRLMFSVTPLFDNDNDDNDDFVEWLNKEKR